MVVAIILSGGTGTRIGGDIPKQYIKVNNRSILSYSLERLVNKHNIDKVMVVAAKEYWDDIVNEINNLMDDAANQKFIGCVSPGATRQLSILSGLLFWKEWVKDSDERLEHNKDYVFIHDAARPYLSDETIDECINVVASHDGVLPVLPMKDTVYMSEDRGCTVSSLLDRGKVYAGQAPEVFEYDKYLQANLDLLNGEPIFNEYDILAPREDSDIYKINGSTEPAIIAGMDIAMIPGDENNYKITTKSDLDRFIASVEL